MAEESSPRKRLNEAQQMDANLNADFPEFPEDCNSLLKKHCPQEVFDQLKDQVTSTGVTLMDCIRSGVQNLDSGVGVYAGDEESYTLFAPMFNPLIQDYHKIEDITANTQPADFDPSHLNCPDVDPNGKYIISTRIRVARNLSGYGLTPTLSQEGRMEVESKVTEVLNGMEGELAGTYYPLTGMDEATQQQLIDDHFLFKKGDRFLEAAGINRDWPEGRGIFHNNDKTFLVWCNEEDQLRIISMQPGGDIGAVFTRLAAAVNLLSERLGFQFNENLGFLSACPTNLGTGMRASVHIKLPRASADPRFQEICDQYHIQPRGIHGEHSETTGGVYDISNKRRLGLSEVECVQSMYDGVKALIELEESLPFAFPTFPEDCNSLLKKHCPQEVFDQLNGQVTSSGVTLMDCIRSGVENLDSGVGVYAGDEESYTLFAPMFNPLIQDYHKIEDITANTQPADFDPSHLECPDVDPENKYIISTRIRVARNLSGYGLTPTLSQQGRMEVESKVTEVLNGMEGELAGTYYPLSGMDAATQQQLIDDHFLFKKGDRFLESAGINRQWPEGRGIFHNNDKTFLVWCNEEDQLRIISMQPGGDIGAVFTRLAAAVNLLSERLGFQFNENLGFLSACPTNLGTGMRASVHIKLPLASADDRFQEICAANDVQPRGIHGEHSETTGGVYDISNKRRLGLSEVECVQSMYNGIKALLELEKELEAAQAS